MIVVSKNIFAQLSFVLKEINQSDFTMPLEIFSGASIGQHVRHILEFYICLVNCKSDCVNYDTRDRDLKLESDLAFTLDKINQIDLRITQFTKDIPLKLEAKLGKNNHTVTSSLSRELLYVVEHAVHHMAILKMGMMINFPNIKLPDNFGVADSTLQYRNRCAQ